VVMNPRTHPRGARPDFTLPNPNPNPERITDALWWLRCMRLLLEPLSEDGGILAIKPGYHSYGSRLPNFGEGDPRTDHSIRRLPDRVGPWWRDFASAHDWTFDRAHTGNYTEIKKYTRRLRDSMRSLTDTRADDVYAYTIGQIDDDRTVEGWNEYRDDDETGDSSHLWHRHDSFRRNIVGSFWAMWKALTIDMGWTYAEWLASTTEKEWDAMATKAEVQDAAKAGALAALQQPVPYILPRIKDRGWADLSVNGKLDYLFEQTAAAQTTDVDGDGDLDGNSVQARLTRVEATLAEIKALLAPPAQV